MLSLMDICEVGNRVPEALEWLARYNAFVPQNSPEYPGLRFREARLYRKLGDATRAQACLKTLFAIMPIRPLPGPPRQSCAPLKFHAICKITCPAGQEPRPRLAGKPAGTP